MITITSYTISPSRALVSVEFRYSVSDPVTGEDFERLAQRHLPDGEGALASTSWSDADLCAALATELEQPVESVQIG